MVSFIMAGIINETLARFMNKDKKIKKAPLCVEKLANNGVLDCIFRLDSRFFNSFSQLLRIEQESLTVENN